MYFANSQSKILHYAGCHHIDRISDEFLDAITGGLVTSMKTMTDAFSAWGEEE